MVVAKSSGEKRRLLEGGSLGSGDLLYRAAVDHHVCDSVVSEALEPYSGRLRLKGTALAELVVQRRLYAQSFRLPGYGIRARKGARAKNLLCIRPNDTGVDAAYITDL